MLESNANLKKDLPLSIEESVQKQRLSNNDVIINVSPLSLDDIPPEIMHIITAYVPYTDGVASLSQTAKIMKKLVDHTHAGKRAQEARHLEPSNFRKWCLNNEDSKKFSLACSVMGSVICSAVFVGVIAAPLSCFSHENNKNMLFFYITLALIGGLFGGAMGAEVIPELLRRKSNFFSQTENQLAQIKKIREELKRPISPSAKM